MPFVLRRADVADASRLGEITVAGWRHAYRGIVADARLDGLDVAALADARREMIAAPEPAAVFVAQEAGVVVGYCAVAPARDEPGVGQLSKLYLDPGVIGRGVGAALHDAGMAHLRAAGFTEATLWIFAGNEGAVRFYERRGWHVDGDPVHPPEWDAPGVRLRRT